MESSKPISPTAYLLFLVGSAIDLVSTWLCLTADKPLPELNPIISKMSQVFGLIFALVAIKVIAVAASIAVCLAIGSALPGKVNSPRLTSIVLFCLGGLFAAAGAHNFLLYWRLN